MEFLSALYLELFPSLAGAIFVLGLSILGISVVYYMKYTYNQDATYGSAVDFFSMMGMTNGFALILIGAIGTALSEPIILLMVILLAVTDYVFLDSWKKKRGDF